MEDWALVDEEEDCQDGLGDQEEEQQQHPLHSLCSTADSVTGYHIGFTTEGQHHSGKQYKTLQ